MLRVLYLSCARLYYQWALATMHPAHPDHGVVAMRHALLSADVDAWLRGGA